MACTVTVTGGCTTATDSYGCLRTLPETISEYIGDVFVQGYDDHFEITWNLFTNPDYNINVFYRIKGDSSWYDRTFILKSTGGTSSETIPKDTIIELFLRQESTTETSTWQRFDVIVNASWDSNDDFVPTLDFSSRFNSQYIPLLFG